ncbi:hypothetical protein M3N55_10440 [Roseibaca sp. V10]|uniref:Uncharacterized protein n=1 Tax=Roseinatronobacter domitianus TaxID=2940293 RepID=A0ABT0M2S2_9RHOB|nr:hypothetical protein [Roseibaca domitiana]MCL1629150.1 hypothetical protein [Roseibaca domitiana]
MCNAPYAQQVSEADPQITLCFFGITRSLPHTIDALRQNVINPAQALGPCRIFAHFFDQRQIDNPRSGEHVGVGADDWKLLAPDWIQIDPPDQFLPQIEANKITSFGDTWGDGGRSRRNLLHQLRSLDIVTEAALADPVPDRTELFLFLRPDLLYHDDFTGAVGRLLQDRADQVVTVANWQHWRGLNDRFALCKGRVAARTYGNRLGAALEYCSAYGPLHGEKLLKHVVRTNPVTLRLTKLRASRVRANGTRKPESFLHYRLHNLKWNAIAMSYRIYKATGLAQLRKGRSRP